MLEMLNHQTPYVDYTLVLAVGLLALGYELASHTDRIDVRSRKLILEWLDVKRDIDCSQLISLSNLFAGYNCSELARELNVSTSYVFMHYIEYHKQFNNAMLLDTRLLALLI